ncbi:hypothetical protein EIP86_006376 [Pleurotus ostreatoroseus]|nr:hypothetical protein EIP86_006376 [Pleurotus ostreatoroseus]
MVFVNDQKFACESCIKGHRSSSCTHNDRPLFEVKKKGRPVSQSSTKRYIPILPSLPNGLKDAFANSKDIPQPADPRARVDSLLNPCHCADVLSCVCEVVDDGPVASSSGSAGNSRLDALAQAAASLCCGASSAGQSPEPQPSSKSSQKHKRDSPKTSPKSKSKRLRRRSPAKPANVTEQERGPVLPPILSDTLSLSTASSCCAPPPIFPDIPPISSIVSLAGTGCTCGFDCSCPGCVEHRGPEHVEQDHDDCADTCSTCIDNQLGLELPTATPFGCVPSTSSTSAPDFLEAFFAKAAAIPPPPPERAFARTLDEAAKNVTVYPALLFNGESKTMDERGRAFGLVRVPKLECCAGRCGCPGDSCGCGDSCDGCCEGHSGEEARPASSTKAVEVEETPVQPPTATKEVRSCCASKAK